MREALPGAIVRPARARSDLIDGRHDERLLHPEHGVAVEIWILGHEQVRDQRLESLVRDHEVYVGRAVGVAPGGLQHVPDRSVIWNRVERRDDRPEPEPAGGVGDEPGAELRTVTALLHIVETIVIRVPDVDD